MSLPVVVQFGGNPESKYKVTFQFTFFVLLSLIVNVSIRHEDGGGELYKMDVLIVVS